MYSLDSLSIRSTDLYSSLKPGTRTEARQADVRRTYLETVADSARFERGFVAHADFIDKPEKKALLIADDPGWATVETLEGHSWPNALLAKAPLRALRQLDRPISGEVWQALSARREPLPLRCINLFDANVDLVEIRKVLPKVDTATTSRRTIVIDEIAAFVGLELRRMVMKSWYRNVTELAAAQSAFEAECAKVEGLAARVSELVLYGPFAARTEVEPVVFVSDERRVLRRQL